MDPLPSEVSSPSDAIKLLGGTKAVQEFVSRPFTTVASWAVRESIPAEFWPKLIEMAERGGVTQVTYEALAQAHERAAKNRKPRAA